MASATELGAFVCDDCMGFSLEKPRSYELFPQKAPHQMTGAESLDSIQIESPYQSRVENIY